MRQEPLGAGSTRRSFLVQAALESAIFAALIGVLLVSVTRGFQEPAQETAGEGLQGILPFEPPRDLDFESFARLGGNWQQWGEDTGALVSSLYLPEEPLSIEQQRELLQQLRRRQETMERALNDPRYRSIWDTLITLHGRMQRRLDMADAILDVVEMDPRQMQDERLQGARQDVLTALQDLRSYLYTIPRGEAWLRYVRADDLAAAVSGPGRPGDIGFIQSVQQKLADPGPQADPQQREFSQRPPFQALERALRRYLDAATSEPLSLEQLREALARIVQEVEEYELENLRGDASGVRAAYNELRRLAPAAARRITQVLTRHYFNYNVRIIASEDFLQKFVTDVRTEASPVRDFVLGANVYGNQVTQTTTNLNLKPGLDAARFDIQVNGAINSNTVGVTSQARVYTAGWHQFLAQKEVSFDGEAFYTQPTRVGVNVNNRTLDVNTNLSGIPLIGHIADHIAEGAVARRGPQSRAITQGKIVSRVSSEMDREVDQRFADAHRDLQEFYGRLRGVGLYPAIKSFRTTENELYVNARVWDGGELAASTPSPLLNQGMGVTIHLHESFLNNAADRLNLAGRTMTDAEIERELERFFSQLLGRRVNFDDTDDPPPADDEAARGSFIFMEEDPVRVQIVNGAVELSIRAGLRREGEEDIPPQIITIPLIFEVNNQNILVRRGNVRVAPVGRPPNVTEQIARAGIMRRKIESSLPDRTRDRFVDVEFEDRPSVRVWITRMKALNGWLTVWAQ